jgi:hypothetical protein
MQKVPKTQWTTKAGTFATKKECKIQFSLPKFHENRIIEWTVHVDDTEENFKYDMIVDRDLLEALGISINFAEHTITWDNATAPMKDNKFMKTPINAMHNSFYWKNDLHETDAMQSATSRLKQILDAKYDKADLKMSCQECKHLSYAEQQQRLEVL